MPVDTLPPPADDPAAPPPTVPPARPIQFVHRGRTVSVAGVPATTSVLAWLREHQHCTGTKEGCNEGDCGACTVLVGELDAQGQVQLRPINSCIQFLPTLDGKALLTVEDLGGHHPAQQAMVACHGSQCGFCTPGFVMSLAACHQQHAQAGTVPTRQQIADDLSGNLCRCTGYRPILDAGQQMFAQPAAATATAAIDTAALAPALAALAPRTALHYADGATPFHAPRTLDDLATLRAARPQARLLAGSTDIGLWVNKQFRDLGEVVYIGEVAALKAISVADGELRIGAGASLEAAWAALATHWPDLREMGLRFASKPIREAGTIGGNIANGSPIGDSAPVLMALDATLLLRHGARTRTLPLAAFYLDYMKNQLVPGEFVQAIHLPLPAAADQVRAYKLSKRYDCDISAVACGLWLQLDGTRVADARFAFGGMAATVRRAAAAEQAVRGQPWTEATVRAAMAALATDYQPLTDLRASASYRRRVAAQLLMRLWLETRPDQPLSAAETTVWQPLGARA
jgi:xanthine dehydrogenase small subunit